MRNRATPRLNALTALLIAALWHAHPAGALLVGNWNIANRPRSAAASAAADLADLRVIAQHLLDTRGVPDVLTLQETDRSTPDFVDVLNSVFPGAPIAFVESPSDQGSDRTALLWNTQTTALVSHEIIGTGSVTHPATAGVFRSLTDPVAPPISIWSVHLESGNDRPNRDQRARETPVLRQAVVDADRRDVILAGDFNWFGDEESVSAGRNAWQGFTDPGPGRLFDVVDAVGTWRDNPAFLGLHTQDPGARVDDRFDMHMVTAGLLDGIGWDYLAASYAVLGNNATHTLNEAITTGTGADAASLAALASFSDHLPVFAEYGYRAVVIPEPAGWAVVVTAGVWVGLRRRQ